MRNHESLLLLLHLIVIPLSFVPVIKAWIAPSYSRATLTLQQLQSAPADNAADADKNPHGLRTLYPPAEELQNGKLRVDELHTLNYRIYGQKRSSGATVQQQQQKQKQHAKKKVALVLHGGPGSGCFPKHAQFFDANKYDVVLLDQRGSGQSSPRGQVYSNTLPDLVHDCERVRQHVLPTNRPWDVVLGGSWGSTLAIAYAQTYPISIRAMILRGVCTFRPSEIDWLFASDGGAARANPEAWKDFAAVAHNLSNYDADTGEMKVLEQQKPLQDHRRAVLHTYCEALVGRHSTPRWQAARGWMIWEGTVGASSPATVARLFPQLKTPTTLVLTGYSQKREYQDPWYRPLSAEDMQEQDLPTPTEAMARVRQGLENSEEPISPPPSIGVTASELSELASTERFGNFTGLPGQAMLTCFYSTNVQTVMGPYFNRLGSSQSMANIRHIPCIAIQGGADPICPPDTALDIQEIWPELELRLALTAGHSMYDTAIAHEIVQATDRLAQV